jgi:manganese transport protein
MVSVGYMDPGNWATDLEGGARFGHQLLWVLLASNLMALLLQGLSAKLGLVTGLDLAQACRANYAPKVSVSLWVLAEIAIIACDLAELLGSAIALNLLFGLPLVLGAALTSLDVLVILGLQRWGARRLEAAVFALLLTIAICLSFELSWAAPKLTELGDGLIPRLNGENLYIAIAILGATVMPHNLYLQSGLVRGVPPATDAREQAGALRRSFWSTALALNLALFVNAAILLLAARAFGHRHVPVLDLGEAYHLLSPILGASGASLLFAIGLLCAGQSATVTGTLAGQIVMEGFVDLRIAPWRRRLITRGLAIVPAIAVLSLVGPGGATPLLVFSQVVLSFQLPFAVVPLIRLTNAPQLMGRFASGPLTRRATVVCAVLILSANTALVVRTVQQLAAFSPVLAAAVAVLGVCGLAFLGWICWVPLRSDSSQASPGIDAEQRALLDDASGAQEARQSGSLASQRSEPTSPEAVATFLHE